MARQKYIENVGQLPYTPEEEAEANALEQKHLELVKNFKEKIQLEETKKASGKQKLLDLGLSEDEVKAMIGI